MSLRADWVDALFARLSVRYGVAFTRQYEGLDLAAVRGDWADVLDGFSGDDIAHALQVLPADKPPNALQFRDACRRAPNPPSLALGYSPARQTPEQRAKLQAIADDIGRSNPNGRYCLNRLRTFEARTGQRLSAAQRFQIAALEHQFADRTEAA